MLDSMPFGTTPVSACDRQFRAARAMLGWSLVETAKKASLSVTQVVRCEKESSRDDEESRRSLTDAFFAAGVRFFDHGLEGRGLLFRSLS